MRRREFMFSSLCGAGAALAPEMNAGTGAAASEVLKIENRQLRLEYDLGAGLASVFTVKGRPLLLNATAAVAFPRGLALAADSNYRRRGQASVSREPALGGEQLVVACEDANRALNLECRFTLLTDRAGVVFELVFTNVSNREIQVRHAEPLRALLDDRAGCFFNARRLLTNGYMHHTPGDLLSQGRSDRELAGFWNMAFHNSASQETLVAGYLENRQAEGQIAARWEMARDPLGGRAAFNLTARSLYNRYFVVRPGASVTSGKLLFLLAPDPFQGLEYYAETYGRLHRVKLNPIINGWCSWFYTHGQSTEDEQLRNAEFIARHLKPYGMEWVQIDDGYQRAFGDWESNERYPHGMKWLATRIREMGLRAGIWIAPFAISENTEIARRHPDWLIHDAQGRLQADPSTAAKYALDVTHPEARRWLHELFHTIRHDWGYEFIKTDFPGWTILAAERYHDPSFSRAQAYRLGVETMRAAIGPDCHLLDCGPTTITAGLMDSMRVDQDTGALDWEQYAKSFNSIAPALAKRYYFHKRVWINDGDHLGLARLTIPQAQAAASVLALSGGTMISGDRLPELDAARLEILKKVFPSYGEAAKPLDLFEKQSPEIFALQVRKDFGTWWLVGYFNWDEGATVRRDLDLARLGMDTRKTWLAYEFWSQRFLAEATRGLSFSLDPSSVSLVAIREKADVPQVLGTDRHFTQGGIELESVKWDAASRSLSGAALGGRGTSWRMAVYVPAGHTWAEEDPEHFHDYDSYSVISFEKGILRVRFDFRNAERINWSLRFR